MNSSKPLVSIVCLTFNHEAYIANCLDSFLMQETNFSYEILIHDDASSDNTVKLIENYRTKHPDIIKPIYQTENQYSKGLGFIGLRLCFKKAQGKYIAYCEGDDYWIDSLKLQKQVNLLEEKPEYNVATHDTVIRSNFELKKDGVLFSKLLYNIFLSKPKKVYTLKDTFTGNIFHISSIMFRNAPVQFPKWINRFSACDMVLYMLLAKEGDIFYMNDVMSVYRNNVNSLTSTRKEYSSQINFLKMSLQLVRLMNRYFKREYQHFIHPIIARYYVELAFLYLKKSNRSISDAKTMASMARKYNSKTYMKYMLLGFFQLIKNRIS